MPSDGRNWTQTETKPDLSKPSAEGLSYLLRHSELWPRGFRWGYGCHGTCAIGLANEFWLHRPFVWAALVGHACGIPHPTAKDIFLRTPGNVTAEKIADRIDAYLAETRK